MLMRQSKVDSREKLITNSWLRCENAGLRHESEPEIQICSEGDLSDILGEHQVMLTTAREKVLPQYTHLLSNSNCLIMMSNNQGQILDTWNRNSAQFTEQPAFFKLGASWKENLLGTNAIGTALETGSLVQINHNEHYLLANRFMSGAAAPIFGNNREIIGAIDISSDAYMPQAHMLGMVKLMSLALTNHILLAKNESRYFSLWFNTSPENLDSQWSALLIFDEQGMIISANQRAETVFKRNLVGCAVTSLFHFSLSTLFSTPEQHVFSLVTSHNLHFYARYSKPTHGKFNLTQQVPASEDALDQLNLGDAAVNKAVKQARKMVNADIPILITGETGVGKEVFVTAMHEVSERSDAHIVAVNCAAIPAELVESELFGYVKGSFTGANAKGNIGLIRKAHKGTLFLDEIGDMPLHVQTRLLRVLQERKVTPIGSTESFDVDFKLISATHRDLKKEIASGSFRQDLYYRITGLNIRLPSVRDRSDKSALISHLVQCYTDDHELLQLDKKVKDAFVAHPWPGNIRQMVNVIQVAFAMADDEFVRLSDLPDDFFDDIELHQSSVDSQADVIASEQVSNVISLESSSCQAQNLDDVDWLSVYHAQGGNVSKSAKVLGVSRNTLYKKLRVSGLK